MFQNGPYRGYLVNREILKLLDYITKKIPKSTKLYYLGRANLALLDGLTAEGFEVISLIGYNNKPKSNISANINQDDVLLLSSYPQQFHGQRIS